MNREAEQSAFRIDCKTLAPVGHGLHRPECVLCTSDGSIWTSRWPGGVTRIFPDGRQQEILASNLPFELFPNGIAMMPDGSLLLANLGDEGGIWRLYRDGKAEPFLTEVAGQPLPPSNFVMVDRLGRVWITVSTRQRPRSLAYRKTVADGFIILVDGSGARIVAEGLGFTNELMFDANMEWLYVNETFARRLSRFRIDGDGLLYNKETVACFGAGSFPDGLALDEQGGIWIASIISNRIMRVEADKQPEILLEDSHAGHLAWIEEAYERDEINRPHMDTMKSRKLKSTSSIAFGGPDCQHAYLGCLLGQQLFRFDSPVRGHEPVHWHWGDRN